jgi:hypothetical protein
MAGLFRLGGSVLIANKCGRIDSAITEGHIRVLSTVLMWDSERMQQLYKKVNAWFVPIACLIPDCTGSALVG